MQIDCKKLVVVKQRDLTKMITDFLIKEEMFDPEKEEFESRFAMSKKEGPVMEIIIAPKSDTSRSGLIVPLMPSGDGQ